MKRSMKLILALMLSVLCAFFFCLGCDGCSGEESPVTEETGMGDKKDNDDKDTEDSNESNTISFKSDDISGVIVFSDDYTLTEDNVKETDGNNSVKITKPVIFNLNGHVLDLNGYTMDIGFDNKGVVEFRNGTIKNGTLSVAVPNGDIKFDAVTLSESVTSNLHAASETIHFSNAKIEGKSTIQSNTNVQIRYSKIENITLTGNATLSANNGATLGSLTVAEGADNANVTVSDTASVSSVDLKAPAEAKISGNVNAISVAATAKNAKVEVAKDATVQSVDINAPVVAKISGKVNAISVAEKAKAASNETFDIEIGESAQVTKVELQAAVSLDIVGKVTKLDVAESASENANNFSIKVKDGAQVAQVSLSAKTDIEISGEITQMVVEESAQGSNVNFTETAVIEVAIVVKAEDAKIQSENQITVHVVETVQNVDLGAGITKNEIASEEIEELIQHVHVWIVKSSVAPDCTNSGRTVYCCEDCGETKTKIEAALGHDWEYKVITEPTASKEGKSIRTCKRCGLSEEVSVKALDSIAVKGLNTIAELVGDGSYTINMRGGVTMSDFGNVAKVKNIKLVINSKDGKLSGLFEADMSVLFDASGSNADIATDSVLESQDVAVKGKLENECITAYVIAGDEGIWVKIPVDFLFETIVSKLKTHYGLDLNIDSNSYPDVKEEDVEQVENIVTDIAEQLIDEYLIREESFTQLKRNILALLFKTTVDGDNTVYTYDSETINAIGDKKIIDVIHEVLGENVYEDLKTLISGSLDKTGVEVFVEIVTFAAEHDIDLEDIFSLIQNVMPQGEEAGEGFDFVAMYTQYGTKTVAEIIADELHLSSADEAKSKVNLILSKADAFVDGKIGDYIDEIPSGYVELAGMVKMIADAYCDNFSFTLDKDGNLVSYEIKLVTPEIEDAEMAKKMPKIDFTCSWTQDEQFDLGFDVEVMGVAVSLKDIENGKEFYLNVFDEVEVDVTASAGDGGVYQLVVDIKADGVEGQGEFSAIVKDGGYVVSIDAGVENVNVNGSVDVTTVDNGVNFAINGNVTEDEHEIGVDLKVGVVKGEPLDELVKVNEIDYSGLQNFKVSGKQYGQDVVMELKRVTDAKGTHYELIKTTSYFDSWSTIWENDELKRNENGHIMYKGTYIVTTYKAVIKEFNGVIDTAVLAMSDCKDWYELSFAAYGEVVGKVYRDTTFVFVDTSDAKQVIALGTLDEESSQYYSWEGIQNFNFYYNPSIAKRDGKLDNAISFESMHNMVSSYKFNSDSHKCEDGVTVTKTCADCGYSYSYITNYHDYKNTEKTFETLCDYDYINIMSCGACGSTEVSYHDYWHDFTYDKHTSLTQSDLRAAGLDATGFYYGTMDSMICSDCELTIQEYIWYSAVNGVCQKHTAVIAKAPAHVGETYSFNAVNIKEVGVTYEHYSISTTRYNVQISPEIEKDGFDLLPASAQEIMKYYDQVKVQENKCQGCGRLQSKSYIYAVNSIVDGETVTNKICYVNMYYKNGNFNSYDYVIYDYDIGNVIAKATEFGIDVSKDLPYGVITYSSYEHYGEKAWETYHDNEFGFIINPPKSSNHRLEISIFVDKAFNEQSAYIIYYDAAHCMQSSYFIDAKTGKVMQSAQDEYHPDYSYDYYLIDGENCNEGVTERSVTVCSVCGKVINVDVNRVNWHIGGEYLISSDLSEYGDYLAGDYNLLNGLSAMVRGHICDRCDCIEHCMIQLTDDWTLQNDVTIKAEDIRFYMNGHTIDLNGHELRIYAYAGSDLVITDAGNYDEGRFAIVDSKKDTEDAGRLVLLTNGGDVNVGSIGIDCAKFISDKSDLYTIDHSIEEGDKMYDFD